MTTTCTRPTSIDMSVRVSTSGALDWSKDAGRLMHQAVLRASSLTVNGPYQVRRICWVVCCVSISLSFSISEARVRITRPSSYLIITFDFKQILWAGHVMMLDIGFCCSFFFRIRSRAMPTLFYLSSSFAVYYIEIDLEWLIMMHEDGIFLS